jgi:hypothetical protein
MCTIGAARKLRDDMGGLEGRPYKSASKCGSQSEDENVAPLRKRSWQQVGRVREIEDARAARRERETDMETFPAPRNIVPRM